MKQQIQRFSVFQNSKVIGILMAVLAVVFAIPFFLFIYSSQPENSPPLHVIFMLPLFYFVFGIVSVGISCVCYNYLAAHIGGIEYETTSKAE